MNAPLVALLVSVCALLFRMAEQDLQALPEQPQRRTWTIPEAAVELGVSTALLRDLIREGSVPVLRLGRRVLVRRATVDRLLAEPEGAEAPIVQLVQARRARSGVR